MIHLWLLRFGNERLKNEIIQEQRPELPAFGLRCEEQSPAPVHIHLRGRTLSPDRVSVRNSKRGKDGSHRVSGERPIEIAQPSRTQHDHSRDDERGNQSCAESGSVEILHGSSNCIAAAKVSAICDWPSKSAD
jgi:hypothetical protein